MSHGESPRPSCEVGWVDLTILILQVGKLRLGEAEATPEGSEAGQEPGPRPPRLPEAQHRSLPTGAPCSPALRLRGTRAVCFGTVRSSQDPHTRGRPCRPGKLRANQISGCLASSASPGAWPGLPRAVGPLPSLGVRPSSRTLLAHSRPRPHPCRCMGFPGGTPLCIWVVSKGLRWADEPEGAAFPLPGEPR